MRGRRLPQKGRWWRRGVRAKRRVVPLSSPTRFGRYIVLDILTGDPGEVTLLAFDPQLDRKVGLKVFDASFDDAADAKRRECAKALAKLVHPHVVVVHDVGNHEGRLFVAMDFVEGVTFDVWQERERPSVRRIVEVFVAAAEGLAAAHEANLIHGSFSANTLVVGDDGQIRVLDFVRCAPKRDVRPPSRTGDRVDLCATMYEALFGLSPWTDDERLRATPLDTKVPLAVRRALMDGLRRDQPAPSMRELATSLRRGLRARRVAWGTALSAVAVLAGVVFATAPTQRPERSWCEGVDARISEVWNEDVAARVRAGFMATGVAFADAAWQNVSSDVERFVAAWQAAERRDCDRGVAAANPAVTLCLHRQYESLRAFVAALEEPTPEIVANVVRATTSLGDPATCDGSTSPLEYGDADLETVLAIQSKLSAAQMLRGLSQYDRSIESALTAKEEAAQAGIRWLEAEADFHAARSRALAGDEDTAERGFHDAFAGAVASGHDEFIARSSMELAQLLVEQGRRDEAKRWIEHARGAVEKEDTHALRVRLAAVEGAAAFRRGDYAAAKKHFTHSGELAGESEKPDPFAKMHAAKMLANTIGRMGDTEAEIELLLDSLEFAEKKLGGAHPNVGHHLNSLGSAYARRGAIDEALEANERAVDIFASVFGGDHPNTIMGLANLASTLHEAGRDEEAEAAYTRALSAAERGLAADDSRRINIVGNAGMFYALSGRFVQAASYLADAAARSEAVNGPDHSHTLGFLNNLAATHMFAGNHEQAGEVYRKLLVRTQRVLGSDHPQVTPCLLGLAEVEANLGHPDRSVPLLRRALQIALDRKDRPERLAVVQFKLAEALWDSKIDKQEAISRARGARQSYLAAAEGGWDIGERGDEVDAWIAERTK